MASAAEWLAAAGTTAAAAVGAWAAVQAKRAAEASVELARLERAAADGARAGELAVSVEFYRDPKWYGIARIEATLRNVGGGSIVVEELHFDRDGFKPWIAEWSPIVLAPGDAVTLNYQSGTDRAVVGYEAKYLQRDVPGARRVTGSFSVG